MKINQMLSGQLSKQLIHCRDHRIAPNKHSVLVLKHSAIDNAMTFEYFKTKLHRFDLMELTEVMMQFTD